MAYDGNKNLIDVIGPAIRGTALQTLSAVIGDAFGGSSSVTFSGDWLVQNTLDGFDRLVSATDAAGGMVFNAFDLGGRTIASQVFGSPGGPTPTDRTGSTNVMLASSEARFDEAGRQYEAQKDVFLDGGVYYLGVAGKLPSGRTVTHTGGGLATNSTTNNHTATVTLTADGTSYVLSRTVYDRADRVIATAADNGAVTTITLDGAGRQPLVVDALGNSIQRKFDGNGNAVFTTRTELCTLSGTIAAETFSSAAAFDVLNRAIVTMEQGPDGSLNTNWVACCTWPVLPPTLFTFTGFDSRNNRTNLVDPKQNTIVWDFDGASRQLREKRHLRPSGDGTTAISATILTQTAFDANSNTIRLVDNNGGVTAWLYDLLDRNTVMQFHDGSTRTNTFDAANDVIGYTDENGSYFANTWDVLGRKTDVVIAPAKGVAGSAMPSGTPAGTLAQAFQFDGLSRPTFCRDSVGTVGVSGLTNADVGFTRDSINRVLEEQQTYLGDTRYVTHNSFISYTSTGFTFPNSRQIAIGFDALYRKNAINEGTSGGASIAAWQFFGGRIATVALGNGITTSFMNNAQTRSAIQFGQTTPPWGSISTDQLGYDGSGRPIGKRHILAGTTIVGFTTAYARLPLYAFVSSNPMSFTDPLGLAPIVGGFSGINSSNNYVDSGIVKSLFAGDPSRQPLGWFDQMHSNIGISDIALNFLSTKALLDSEAQQLGSQTPLGFYCVSQAPAMTPIRVLMLNPKTATKPPTGTGGCACCNITVDIWLGSADVVPNQAPFQPDDERYWRAWALNGGEVVYVDDNSFVGHLFSPYLSGTVNVVQSRQVDVPMRTGQGNTSVPQQKYVPTGQTRSLKQWLTDHTNPAMQGFTFVCHSQGCKILMDSLARGCQRQSG